MGSICTPLFLSRLSPTFLVSSNWLTTVLAGSMLGAGPAGAAAAAADEETKPAPGDVLPLKYTVVSTAAFLLLS